MTEKPTPPIQRIISLLKVGPVGIVWRVVDQATRKVTGTPAWYLTRITPYLYVGGQHSLEGWSAMQAEGIEAVLNMREAHHDDVAKGIGGVYHLHLPTRDNTPPSLDALEKAAQFITENIQAQRGVYVHCGVGVGRAPSAAAAYLIQQGLSVDEALKVIKHKRPFIHLTNGQYQQLVRFEALCRQNANPTA